MFAQDTRSTVSRAICIIVLLLLVSLAFLIRIQNWPQVFVGDEVRCMENDAFYHMHRVFSALSNNFKTYEYDQFLNYPKGFHCNWTPLFDISIAATAYIAGAGHPSADLVKIIGALIPPIIGSLNVILIYIIARFFFNRSYSLVSALIFLFLPYHISVSVLGRPDHHVMVVFLASGLMISLMATIQTKKVLSGLLFAALSGILLGACLLTWMGSTMLSAIILCFFVLACMIARKDNEDLNFLTIAGSLLFLAAAIIIAPFASHSYWQTNKIPSWEGLNNIHTLTFILCALIISTVRLTIDIFKIKQSVSKKTHLLKLFMLFGLLFIIYILVSKCGYFGFIAKGSDFIRRSAPFINHIYESQPITASAAMENFTAFVFLFPLMLIWMLYQTWKQEHALLGIFFFTWTFFTGIIVLFQERFSDLFSISAAIMLTLFVTTPFRPPAISKVIIKITASLASAAVVFLACFPTIKWLGNYKLATRLISQDTLYEACYWIRDNTRHYVNNTPDYSIMAEWTMGHAITYVGKRANVANNFVGWEENHESNIAPYKFLLSNDIMAAENILRKSRVKYIVTTDMLNSGLTDRIIDILKLNRSDYFYNAQEGSDDKPVWVPTDKLYNSIGYKLYYQNGYGLDRFKLVYESKERIKCGAISLPVYRIFEYMPLYNSY